MEFGKKAKEYVENGLLVPDEIVTAVLLGHFPVGSNINAHQQNSRDSELGIFEMYSSVDKPNRLQLYEEGEKRKNNSVLGCYDLCTIILPVSELVSMGATLYCTYKWIWDLALGFDRCSFVKGLKLWFCGVCFWNLFVLIDDLLFFFLVLFF